MSKKSLVRRNDRRKAKAKIFGKKRQTLLEITKNLSLSFEERLNAQIKVSEMPRDSSLVRYRNRCSLTGRPRGNYRKFSLSRLAIRELASFGQIPGVIKSSW